MNVETKTDLIVDRSLHGELLRINFDVSFPALSCEYATLDISDALGLKRLNLTKTVRKAPIEGDSLQRTGAAREDSQKPEPLYDEHHPGEQYDEADFATPLNGSSWDEHMKRYDIVVVNYYAPWCPWCQRLAPTWEAVTEAIHEKYPDADGRLRFAKVDCTVEVDLCRRAQVTAFPSIRVYNHGSDDVEVRCYILRDICICVLANWFSTFDQSAIIYSSKLYRIWGSMSTWRITVTGRPRLCWLLGTTLQLLLANRIIRPRFMVFHKFRNRLGATLEAFF